MNRIFVFLAISLTVAVVPTATAADPIHDALDLACRGLEPLYGSACRVVSVVEGATGGGNACDANYPLLEPLYGSACSLQRTISGVIGRAGACEPKTPYLEPLYGSEPYQMACEIVVGTLP